MSTEVFAASSPRLRASTRSNVELALLDLATPLRHDVNGKRSRSIESQQLAACILVLSGNSNAVSRVLYRPLSFSFELVTIFFVTTLVYNSNALLCNLGIINMGFYVTYKFFYGLTRFYGG